MDTLDLRNVNYGFEYSGVFESKSEIFPSYYNSEHNNLLLFDINDCDDITVTSICNSTVSEGAYDYLTHTLNTRDNVLVLWSQVEGTTSDYTIYYNSNNEDLIDDISTIDNATEINNLDDVQGYKFKEVTYGIGKRIVFQNR